MNQMTWTLSSGSRITIKEGQSKVKKRDKYTEAVFFVPYTSDGILRSSLMKMESKLDFENNVKYSEELGRTVADMLVRKDPEPIDCGRQNCFTCRSEAGKCQRQNLIYEITCITCQRSEKVSIYVGETARTSFDRGAEHLNDLKRKSKESPLVNHQIEDHEGQECEFQMKVKEFAKTNIMRQALEAHHIELHEGKGTNLLNRRGEWGSNLSPQMVVENSKGEVQVRGLKRSPWVGEKAVSNKRQRVSESESELETGVKYTPLEIEQEIELENENASENIGQDKEGQAKEVKNRFKNYRERKVKTADKPKSKHLKASEIVKMLKEKVIPLQMCATPHPYHPYHL